MKNFLLQHITTNTSSNSWLINKNYKNHMTIKRIFLESLTKSSYLKLKLKMLNRSVIAIESLTDLKYIYLMFYMWLTLTKICLVVLNFVKNGFKAILKDNWCLIKDTKGKNVFRVKMRSKTYILNLMEDEQIIYSSTTWLIYTQKYLNIFILQNYYTRRNISLLKVSW